MGALVVHPSIICLLVLELTHQGGVVRGEASLEDWSRMVVYSTVTRGSLVCYHVRAVIWEKSIFKKRESPGNLGKGLKVRGEDLMERGMKKGEVQTELWLINGVKERMSW